MSFREHMFAALADYLRDNIKIDAVSVVDFEDRTESGGYCESCWHEYAVCDITYINSAGNRKVYTYQDSFADLISGLS